MSSGFPRWSVLAAVALAALGCASAPAPRPTESTAPTAPPPAATPAETAPRAPEGVLTGLVFAVEPADAQISIDGNARGAVAELAAGRLLPLAPGIYQVSLKAAGFVTWRAEVALRAGTETIRVNLTRKP